LRLGRRAVGLRRGGGLRVGLRGRGAVVASVVGGGRRVVVASSVVVGWRGRRRSGSRSGGTGAFEGVPRRVDANAGGGAEGLCEF
jgi:hypothetical protein